MKSWNTAFAMGLFTVVLGVAGVACSSSSSGGNSGGNGGSSGSGCSGLSSCCGSLPSADQSSCQQLASENDATACDEAITEFHEANLCTNVSAGTGSSTTTGGGGSSSTTASGGNCSTLKSCCSGSTFTGSAAELQPGCMSVYTDGTDAECSTYLMDLQALGTCN